MQIYQSRTSGRPSVCHYAPITASDIPSTPASRTNGFNIPSENSNDSILWSHLCVNNMKNNVATAMLVTGDADSVKPSKGPRITVPSLPESTVEPQAAAPPRIPDHVFFKTKDL
ncbi:hypothetical protein MAJ_07663, partial [Metarhizium majus ARSEF 297]